MIRVAVLCAAISCAGKAEITVHDSLVLSTLVGDNALAFIVENVTIPNCAVNFQRGGEACCGQTVGSINWPNFQFMPRSDNLAWPQITQSGNISQVRCVNLNLHDNSARISIGETALSGGALPVVSNSEADLWRAIADTNQSSALNENIRPNLTLADFAGDLVCLDCGAGSFAGFLQGPDQKSSTNKTEGHGHAGQPDDPFSRVRHALLGLKVLAFVVFGVSFSIWGVNLAARHFLPGFWDYAYIIGCVSLWAAVLIGGVYLAIS